VLFTGSRLTGARSVVLRCQLVSVYVNNWCGTDGEQADASSSDYNTLPHYQRYQRCLQHQQQACIGHYHTGQRAQLLYETVGRSRNCVDGARATLCSRHGRSNSLSPGRARYAAGQLCSTARFRRPLMPPADSETVPAVEAAVSPGASTGDEPAASSSASVEQRDDLEQSASSTVDDAFATNIADVSDRTSAELKNVDNQPAEVPLQDDANSDANRSDVPADVDQPVTESRDLQTDDAERCTEERKNDGEVMEVKMETEEQIVEGGTVNQKEAGAMKDDYTDVTNDVGDGGDSLIGEVSSKDSETEAADNSEGSKWCSESPVIRFEQADTTSTKFDSSALEKILNSLSATSRRDHDGLTTNDCNHRDNNNDDDDDDEIWMRRDVVADAYQSSLSMLDAAVAQLDNNGLHFKSRRRRSTSSSSSSSVGHCSPSCLMPPSTLDTDTDTSTTCLLSCDTSTDATVTLIPSTAPTTLPSTSTGVEPAEMHTSSQTAG